MNQRVLRHLVASFPVRENPLNTVRSGLFTRPQKYYTVSDYDLFPQTLTKVTSTLCHEKYYT